MNRLIRFAAFAGKFSLVGLAAAAIAIVIASRIDPGAVAGGGADPRGLRTSYAEAVRAATPAVVSIFADKLFQQMPVALQRDAQSNQLTGRAMILGRPRLVNRPELGSGVIVSSDGYILTNFHVIEGADSINVRFWDGRMQRALVVGYDEETDLAVLQIEFDGELPTIPYGGGGELQVGDVVLAIGNPLGLGQAVTMGIVSGTGRSGLGVSVYENLIQTDAAINKGNSGGALINSGGELIGINAAMIGTGGAEGIGFAIPIETAQDVLQQIVSHGEVVRGWLGVEMDDGRVHPRIVAINGNRSGVLITQVYPNQPGDLAGLEPSDYLTRFGDTDVTNLRDLYTTIAETKPGTVVELELWREGTRVITEATLIQRPPKLLKSG